MRRRFVRQHWCILFLPLHMRKLLIAAVIAVVFGGGWALLYMILG